MIYIDLNLIFFRTTMKETDERRKKIVGRRKRNDGRRKKNDER